MSKNGVGTPLESGNGDCGGGHGAPAALAAGTAAAPASINSVITPQDLAVSVTRQVQISQPDSWKHLACGIDTLDLGLYVDWRQHWHGLEDALLKGKQAAERTQGIQWEHGSIPPTIILPSGKPPMYAFHLQTADFHVFIARRDKCSEKFPNVYVSILAKSLWLRGVNAAVENVSRFVAAVGGSIERAQVSRADLCADFIVPGGLTLDFLRTFRVSRSPSNSQFLNGDKLETFYIGGRGSPLQARVYDKSIEILQDGLKLWFVDEVWKIQNCRDVWRVEFQLRREVLAQMKIDSVSDLRKRAAGVWKYLTEDWFSLRHQDNPNQTRRTVHPWWQVVQEVGQDFGDLVDVKRDYASGGQALVEWYVSHAGGCLPGYAARMGVGDFDSVLGAFTSEICKYWDRQSFSERYQIERIKLGFSDSQEAGET